MTGTTQLSYITQQQGAIIGERSEPLSGHVVEYGDLFNGSFMGKMY